jgi:hypothetical protein
VGQKGGLDAVKIWVGDREGVRKLPPPLCPAIIDEAHALSETVPDQEVQRMADALASRTGEAAGRARRLFDVQARNLARLDAAGPPLPETGRRQHRAASDSVAAGLQTRRRGRCPCSDTCGSLLSS